MEILMIDLLIYFFALNCFATCVNLLLSYDFTQKLKDRKRILKTQKDQPRIRPPF